MSSGINLNEIRVRNARTFSSISAETSKSTPLNPLGNSSKQPEQIGKKASRVSLLLNQLETSLVKEYKDLMCDHDESNENFPDMEERNISFNSVFKDVQVKINFEVTMGSFTKMITHIANVSTEAFIMDLIHLGINLFNQSKHEIEDQDGSLYRISFMTSDYNKYDCKPSKKNGKAKLDVPSFCLDATINNTMSENFSLLYKNDCLILVKIKDKKVEEENLMTNQINDIKHNQQMSDFPIDRRIRNEGSCYII